MSKKETQKDQKHNQAEEKADTETPSSNPAGAPQAEFNVNQEIDALIQSLEGDLSTIETESALGLIEQWYGFLHKFKELEVKELASGLKELGTSPCFNELRQDEYLFQTPFSYPPHLVSFFDC